eukprot:scaffold639181_cov15-Prasinocladus_malaysianus.AAC.1
MRSAIWSNPRSIQQLLAFEKSEAVITLLERSATTCVKMAVQSIVDNVVYTLSGLHLTDLRAGCFV